MSLCPNFCDCSFCPHGVQVCTYCYKCAQEAKRAQKQIEHEQSVLKQKSKLKRINH